ncbi:hypothetical protein ARTHRO9AX_220399 [Arthrobacter sp. 9AX]|nr:hypothetical protein ARTHRO9AX_220399 [Arthrobacter sp. 9AX]
MQTWRPLKSAQMDKIPWESGKAGGAQNHVRDGGLFALRSGHRPFPAGLHFQLPPGAVQFQLPDQFISRVKHVVVGVGPSPRRQPVRVMAHHQQSAAGFHGRRRSAKRPLPGQLLGMEELRGHQVIQVRGLPLLQVGLLPMDPAGDGPLGRVHAFPRQGRLLVSLRPFQRDGGNVDGGDGPAVLGKPDRVRPFAAAKVQRMSRPESAGLPHELRVRLAAPDLGLAAVPLIPQGGRVPDSLTIRGVGVPREAGAAVVRCLVFMLVGRVFRHASTLPCGNSVCNAQPASAKCRFGARNDTWRYLPGWGRTRGTGAGW